METTNYDRANITYRPGISKERPTTIKRSQELITISVVEDEKAMSATPIRVLGIIMKAQTRTLVFGTAA